MTTARLSELIWAADPYFDGDYTVVTGGGLVTAFPEYFRRIGMKCPPRARLLLATVPPIFGAAVEAMHRSGLELPEDFEEVFMANLRALS